MTLKLNGTNSEAAPAYAGDDADTGLQCGTNELKLVTGGTARVTVNSSGRLSSESTSQISHKYTGVSSPCFFGQFNSSGDASVNNQANAPLLFATNNTERMRILSDGTLRLASGCPGIDFSQIQTNVSGMTSETLDSYEEGTWTPAISFGGTFNGTYSTNEGFYTKIGRLVSVSAELALSSKGSTTGGVKLGGLPFTPNSDDESRASGVIGYHQDVTAIDFPIQILIEANDTSFPLRDSGSSSSVDISNGNVGNGFRIYFSITYMTS